MAALESVVSYFLERIEKARAELAQRHADPFREKVEAITRGMEAISTIALLDLLGLPKTTGNGRRLAPTMRTLGFVPIKSRRLEPGGYRDTVTRGWARPVRGIGHRTNLKQGEKVESVSHSFQALLHRIKGRTRIMAFEDGHPNVPLADWQNFLDWHQSSKMFPSHPFEQVVDRSQLSLRDNLFPLARGGAIASRSLLRKAGYRSGARQSQRWLYSRRGGRFTLPLYQQYTRAITVAKFGALWMPGRCDGTALIENLVFIFGWTPVLTRTCASAKQLAWDCSQNGLPSGMRWMRGIPENVSGQ